MTRTAAEKRAAFHALHSQGCFVIPNPWDAGSAKLLQHMGFSALASSSAGYAWTIGRPDYAVTRDGVLQHLAALCEAVDIPVNADFESGFASDPQGVADNVTLAIGTGIAGLSIEDRDLDTAPGLYDLKLAVERMRAARQAIDRSGEKVLLVGRTETMLGDPKALTPAIDRLVAFAEAGADCLFAPGVNEKADIVAMVRAVAPKPLTILVLRPGWNLAALADLGVRRVSVGGSLARAAWSGAFAMAEQLKAGTFDGLFGGVPSKQLNDIFRG